MNIKAVIAAIWSSILQIKIFLDVIFKRIFFLLFKPIFRILLIPSVRIIVNNESADVLIEGEFAYKSELYNTKRRKYIKPIINDNSLNEKVKNKKYPITPDQIGIIEVRYPIAGEEIAIPIKYLFSIWKKQICLIINLLIFILPFAVAYATYAIKPLDKINGILKKKEISIDHFEIIPSEVQWVKQINLFFDGDISDTETIKDFSIEIKNYVAEFYHTGKDVKIDQKEILNFNPVFKINKKKIDYYSTKAVDCSQISNNKLIGNNCGELYTLINLENLKDLGNRIEFTINCKKAFINKWIKILNYKISCNINLTDNKVSSKIIGISFAKDIGTNFKEPNIRELQKMLANLGYQPGPIDGRYGPKTKYAIEHFQRDEDLCVDGEMSFSLLAYIKHLLYKKR